MTFISCLKEKLTFINKIPKQHFLLFNALTNQKQTNMKKVLIAILLFTVSFNEVNAQSPAKAIFAEIGGPGLASFNYDQRFSKKEDGLGFRVGLGGFKIDDVGILTVPVALNYLLGKDEKNYFELGVGFTYVNAKDNSGSSDETFSGSFGHLNFGYRMAPKNGGFFFRAAINPIFGEGGFVPFYGGIGFGYKF